ncbi:hypothetical protein E2C05_23385 [Paracraurococcus ruber]|uniref:Uncharacterized protein n=2 Tax=Paracraurococcus ruber TaxID=77675 RepID=A0ABS1D5G3_9PROT|nr:hypothetical protein [Paracraurococcus ruber]TDG27305.1 hypothetical protein E2C05_23385 [Paracraurococcus ruber]
MLARGAAHDASKLVEPEKSGFDRVLPLLRGLSYGSAEYRALEAAEAGLVALHHANNSHHPEHYGNRGIAGMDLFDLVEMLCDWIAAAERHPADGVRLDINVERHGIEPQLASILANTLARWPGTSGRALPGTP